MYKLPVLLVALLVAGCNGSGGYKVSLDTQAQQLDSRYLTDNTETSAPMLLKSEFLIKDKLGQEASTFVVGETLTFELNITPANATGVDYQATPPINSFVVKHEGEEVWSQHHGMMFMQAMSVGKIAPNAPLVFIAQWSGKDNDGAVLQSGRYEVFSEVVLFVNDQAMEVPSPKWITLN